MRFNIWKWRQCKTSVVVFNYKISYFIFDKFSTVIGDDRLQVNQQKTSVIKIRYNQSTFKKSNVQSDWLASLTSASSWLGTIVSFSLNQWFCQRFNLGCFLLHSKKKLLQVCDFSLYPVSLFILPISFGPVLWHWISSASVTFLGCQQLSWYKVEGFNQFILPLQSLQCNVR